MDYGWRDRLQTIAATAALTSLAWVLIGAWLWTREDAGSALPQVAASSGASSAGVAMASGAAEAKALENVTIPAAGRLLVPVQGITRQQLTDTYTQSRPGGRVHNAIDIMAPRGTPVLAAAPGTVEKLFLSGNGGITVYVRSPDRRTMYYYAHLDRYAPGLSEGQPVRTGRLLGYVGATGDANPDAPHLHFAINVMRPEDGWWQGQPVNPYPLLMRE